jgi:3'-phosphoadenosine 5'-phosphosulfate sulfotransferase (PAPS reductase)/FAD synthetase
LWESRHIKTEKTGKFRLEQFQLNNGLNFYRDYSKWNFLLETPFELSHKCCGEMKKKPLHKIKDKQPITAQMADESLMRTSQWLQKGCNAFNTKNPRSNPMSFWLENDILTYIVKHDLPISKAYGEIARDYEKDGLLQGQTDLFSECGLNCNYKTTKCQRTGCCFCGFGVQHDTGRFVLLAEQEPKLCDYVMRGGAFDTDGMWKPTVDGMGYWFVLEWLNVHGNLQIGIPNKEYYLEKYQTDKTRKYLEKE